MKKIILFVIFSLFLVSCGNKIKESKTNIITKDSITTHTVEINLNDSVNHDEFYMSQVVTLKELRAKSLYKINCKFCHGEDGKGDGIKARLNPTICPYDLTKETHTDKFIYYVLLNGENNMPGYSKKLDDSKIKVLVIYIKKFKK